MNKQTQIREIEKKMRKLWHNQAARYGARKAWDSVRFRKYHTQWSHLADELAVEYTVGDVLA